MPAWPDHALQAEAAGLERELELARRQIDIERRKQEEMSKERERWGGMSVIEDWRPGGRGGHSE